MIKQRHNQKLSSEQIEDAFMKLLEGKSLRSLARSYKVDHKTLRVRLLRKYGDKYKKVVRQNGVLAVVKEYISKAKNSRQRAEIEIWLTKNLDFIIQGDIQSEIPLLTEREVKNRTFNQHWQDYNIENNLRVCTYI